MNVQLLDNNKDSTNDGYKLNLSRRGLLEMSLEHKRRNFWQRLALDEPYTTRALHSQWEMPRGKGQTPLLTPHVVHLEPEAIAGPGLNRKKKGLPSVAFCKLRVPSVLGTAWGCRTCSTVAWLGAHLT